MLTIHKCSDGDPCSTCASVESARLWKMPCMRTRVTSEYELYSAGLPHRLNYILSDLLTAI